MENEDIKLSKNYRTIFSAAKKIGNTEDMDRIFNELLTELGDVDPVANQAQIDAGAAAAKQRNAKDRGEGGKKV